MVHSQTRTVVQYTIRLMKGRWRFLDATGEKLSYKPEKVWQIVKLCAVVHNKVQLKNVAFPLMLMAVLALSLICVKWSHQHTTNR